MSAGDTGGLNPDAPAEVYNRLEESAKKSAVPFKEADEGALLCQKPWKFDVQIESIEEDYPDVVNVEIEEQTTIYASLTFEMKSKQSPLQEVQGKGIHGFQPNVILDGWTTVNEAPPERLSLPAFDQKTTIIRIERLPWIKLRVQSHNAADMLPGFQLKLELPGMGKVSPVTTDSTLACMKLKPGTGKLEAISSESDEIWQYVPG
jgi:hypothetical protein